MDGFVEFERLVQKNASVADAVMRWPRTARCPSPRRWPRNFRLRPLIFCGERPAGRTISSSATANAKHEHGLHDLGHRPYPQRTIFDRAGRGPQYVRIYNVAAPCGHRRHGLTPPSSTRRRRIAAHDLRRHRDADSHTCPISHDSITDTFMEAFGSRKQDIATPWTASSPTPPRARCQRPGSTRQGGRSPLRGPQPVRRVDGVEVDVTILRLRKDREPRIGSWRNSDARHRDVALRLERLALGERGWTHTAFRLDQNYTERSSRRKYRVRNGRGPGC